MFLICNHLIFRLINRTQVFINMQIGKGIKDYLTLKKPHKIGVHFLSLLSSFIMQMQKLVRLQFRLLWVMGNLVAN